MSTDNEISLSIRNTETLKLAITSLNERILKQEIRINELIFLVSSMTHQLADVKKIALINITNRGNGATT